MDQLWHPSVEALLQKLGDEAQIRAKLHSRHSNWFTTRHHRYSIPVVILSVICGSGNFVSEHFGDAGKTWVILGVGCLSILTSIISSISTYLKLAQLGESHRIACLSWGKFYSVISLELGRVTDERSDPDDFFRNSVSEYSRLYEISPCLLDRFVKPLSKKLANFPITLPFYMNGYRHTTVYHDGGHDEEVE